MQNYICVECSCKQNVKRLIKDVYKFRRVLSGFLRGLLILSKAAIRDATVVTRLQIRLEMKA